jgi:hypothetical protein
MHGGKAIFEQAAGLHEDVAGLTVVGEFDSDDPAVMFEEHGRDAPCEYFEILVDKELDESMGAVGGRPETRERIGSSDERIAWTAMRAAFLTEQPAFVNQMIRGWYVRRDPALISAPRSRCVRGEVKMPSVIRCVWEPPRLVHTDPLLPMPFLDARVENPPS